jgi:predicted XRE-type DNA-binding protein
LLLDSSFTEAGFVLVLRLKPEPSSLKADTVVCISPQRPVQPLAIWRVGKKHPLTPYTSSCISVFMPSNEKPLEWIVRRGSVCPSLLPEKKQARHRHTEGRNGHHPRKAQNSRSVCKGVAEMKTRLIDGIEVQRGSGNVFTDLGLADAEKLKIKTGLVIEIRKAMRSLGLTQQEAAKRMGITQPKVSDMMRGNFTNLSERKLMDCLTRLGYDIEIKVRPAKAEVGHLILAAA